MPLTLYIFSRDSEMLNSLCRFVKHICINSENIRHEFNPKENARLFSTIENITAILDKKSPSELLETSVLLDLTGKDMDNNSWDVLSANSSITDIAARLCLMYPEVYWIFIGLPSNKPVGDIHWLKEHFFCPPDKLEKILTFLQYHSLGYLPLFDTSGLRSWIKHRIMNKLNRTNIPYLLPPAASAIDEESAYVYLHNYIAYRIGYRCYPVTTLYMMEKLFNSSKDSNAHIDFVFEDIFLNYPDKAIDISLSNLKKRDTTYSRLKDVNKRIFVTVGHEHTDWYDSNREHIKSLKCHGKKVKIVYKPSGGFYNLLHESGLFKDYWKYQHDKRSNYKKTEPKTDHHSTPGKLLEIAEILINRAERLYHEAMTVEECIYGAILASEAIELLDYKTPTTCLGAIALRHKLEVKAECTFYGMEYNIDVKNRLRELKEEIKTISRYFYRSVKEKSSINAQMMIVTEIMKIFREHGQFDEEQECMKYFRTLNRQWYFKRHPYFIIFKSFRWYFDTLIGNFRWFLIAILLLPLILGVISITLPAKFGAKDWDTFDHILNAYFTFYGLQPVEFPENTSAKVLTVILVLAGFFHLGIFVSYLFTILSRRN